MKTFLAAATAAALSLCALTTAHATDKQTNSRDTIVFMQDAELNTVEGAALLLKAFPAKKHQGNASMGPKKKKGGLITAEAFNPKTGLERKKNKKGGTSTIPAGTIGNHGKVPSEAVKGGSNKQN